MKLTPMSFLDLSPQEQLAAMHERGEHLFNWGCDEWAGVFFLLDGFFLLWRHNLQEDTMQLIPFGTSGPLYWAMPHALDETLTLDELGL
jgi:hypothetical protein